MSTGAVAAVLYACTTSAPAFLDKVPHDVGEKKWHRSDGKGFVNPWSSSRPMIGWKIGYEMIRRRWDGKANMPDTTPPTVPVQQPTLLESRIGSKSMRATWLGHACYYVEFPNGLRVLFDPVFEDRCSPSTWLGPKRYTGAPCHIKDLPYVDVVVISHSHYDHLSHPSVMEIKKQHPNVQFLVPLGNKAWFEKCGIDNAVELDWWQDVDLVLSPTTGEKRVSKSTSGSALAASNDSNITARISCLPCQHTSARTVFDLNHTLWASWSVVSGGKSVWFGGDTGYRAVPELPKEIDDYGPKYAHLPKCPAFKSIGELRGSFDLGLIPIGAYDPRHIMSSMHANPFDSVEIFTDTQCKRAMGIHWGTWVLTEEDVLEPPVLLKKALAKKGLPEVGVFDVCDIGESREF